MPQAKGEFNVNLKPLESDVKSVPSADFGRMAIAKTFTGDLNGSSSGEMLSVRTDVVGSAGYVAIELFDGEIAGKKGSFALQHFGIMDKGEDSLILKVVPDSGTGALKGIIGAMKIIREGSGHQYLFDYHLP